MVICPSWENDNEGSYAELISLVSFQYTEQEKDPKFWNTWAQRTLKNALTLQKFNTNRAKNLVFFLGDGKLQNLVTS